MGCSSSKPSVAKQNPVVIESDQKSEEAILNEKLMIESKNLQNLALPMMIRRYSVDFSEFVGAPEQSTSEKQDIYRKKKEHRKNAKLSAEKRATWMLFNNHDVFDHHDMTCLSRFMETALLSWNREMMIRVEEEEDDEASLSIPNSFTEEKSVDIIPKVSISQDANTLLLSQINLGIIGVPKAVEVVKAKRRTSLNAGDIQADDSITIGRTSSENRINVARKNSVDKLIRIDRLILETGMSKTAGPQQSSSPSTSRSSSPTNRRPSSPSSVSESPRVTNNKIDVPAESDEDIPINADELDIPRGPMTIAVASKIIDCYRSGGRLSTKSVHKILRSSFRAISKQPNINRISITDKDRLTVVGDIHGLFIHI